VDTINLYASSEARNVFVTRRHLFREYVRRFLRVARPLIRWMVRTARFAIIWLLLRPLHFIVVGPNAGDGGKRRAKEIVLRF
jgi:hypothetical protein